MLSLSSSMVEKILILILQRNSQEIKRLIYFYGHDLMPFLYLWMIITFLNLYDTGINNFSISWFLFTYILIELVQIHMKTVL